jgi:UDP-N-acetylmuramoyl-L-alanyl-D-glutamate--2,6-diaminopimelate ligase
MSRSERKANEASSTLGELLQEIRGRGLSARVLGCSEEQAGSVRIGGISYDTRTLQPGDLFFAIEGFVTDGHLYVDQAVRKGCAAVVVSEARLGQLAETALPALYRDGVNQGSHGRQPELPVVAVSDTRKALAYASCSFYGHPSQSGLSVIGVTGTNGKTSTTYMVESVYKAAGLRTGLVGTVEIHLADMVETTERTTPEAPDLQRLFRKMLDAGVHACVIEVSSHALALDRVAGTRFAVGVFTNLSHDHLDFHDSMEEYFAAKARLFLPEYSERAAINISDPWGKRLADLCKIPVVTYGEKLDGAEVWAGDVELHPLGSRFLLGTPEGTARVTLPLSGAFAVWNALAATAACVAAGIDLGTIVEGLSSVPQVPGRFEAVDCGQDFLALVDYAHTPASLESLLRSARRLARAGSGKVIVVVGCGGDRDRKKRPEMGRVAAESADLAIFTSDNPRSEDPEAIIEEIVSGARTTPDYRRRCIEISDRRAAIRRAVSEAGPGDVVVIAGKGHERYQEIAGRRIPFDDREVLKEEIVNRLVRNDEGRRSGADGTAGSAVASINLSGLDRESQA